MPRTGVDPRTGGHLQLAHSTPLGGVQLPPWIFQIPEKIYWENGRSYTLQRYRLLLPEYPSENTDDPSLVAVAQPSLEAIGQWTGEPGQPWAEQEILTIEDKLLQIFLKTARVIGRKVESENVNDSDITIARKSLRLPQGLSRLLANW